jgi:hypothetical protein
MSARKRRLAPSDVRGALMEWAGRLETQELSLAIMAELVDGDDKHVLKQAADKTASLAREACAMIDAYIAKLEHNP